jgi:hypothetical protein
LLALVALCVCGLAGVGCVRSTPERTVRQYLQLMSGEQLLTPDVLESLTTEHYRESEHPHLATLAEEHRRQAVDLAAELRQDPVIRQFLDRVKWTTTYEVADQTATEATVIARVIMTQRSPGDREAALQIPGLPKPLRDVLERGLELPFRFELMLESGRWRIDRFEVPEILHSLLDIPGAPPSD